MNVSNVIGCRGSDSPNRANHIRYHYIGLTGLNLLWQSVLTRLGSDEKSEM